MSQITQAEYLKIKDLLNSPNVKDIMNFMVLQYSGCRDEYCNHLLSLIPSIAQSVINRKNSELYLKQKAIETVEQMIPQNKQYPFGMAGVMAYVYSQFNFRKMYLDSKETLTHKHMVTALDSLKGCSGARATVPQFKKYIDECANRDDWENDHFWMFIDNEDCKEMVRWCIANKEKWDDLDDYMKTLNEFEEFMKNKGRQKSKESNDDN